VVVDSSAILKILSDSLTCDEITKALGIEPSLSHDKGDPKGKPRPDAHGTLVQRRYDSAVWSWHAETSDDTTVGPSSLEQIVSTFASRADALATLRESCTILVDYRGHSDSTQGGFVFPAEVVAGLAALGCDVFGSVYTDFAHPDGGIVEKAVLPVRPELADEFEAAFEKAKWIISEADGFRELTLSRGVERSEQYLLLVRWDSVDSHEIGFRQSEAYAEWKELLHRFYDPFPAVEHFREVARIVSERSSSLG
jgi:heme-degrading monooxygenase HmoA